MKHYYRQKYNYVHLEDAPSIFDGGFRNDFILYGLALICLGVIL